MCIVCQYADTLYTDILFTLICRIFAKRCKKFASLGRKSKCPFLFLAVFWATFLKSWGNSCTHAAEADVGWGRFEMSIFWVRVKAVKYRRFEPMTKSGVLGISRNYLRTCGVFELIVKIS